MTSQDVSFDQGHYVPVLKAKRGEFRAIDSLPDELRSNMTPVFEPPFIQPYKLDPSDPNKDGYTIEEQMEKVGGYLRDYWWNGNQSEGNHRPVFMDLRLLNITRCESTGQHPFIYLTDWIDDNDGSPIIPVTGLRRPLPYHSAVKSVADHFQYGAMIRLELTDFTQDLATSIDEHLEFLGLNEEDIHILLDVGSITSSEPWLEVLGCISLIPNLHAWCSFSLASAGFPHDFPLNRDDSISIPRHDWEMYRKVLSANLTRRPAFADYGIRGRDIDTMDIPMGPAPKLAYTTDSNWICFYRRKSNQGYRRFLEICQELTQSGVYDGKSFSEGDSMIHDYVNVNGEGPGNGESWILMSVNHHITKVIDQISNRF